VLVTFAAEIAVRPEGETRFFRVTNYVPPRDPTDYAADRSAVAAFYAFNPGPYWVNFGIPALARLADVRSGFGLDPWATFDGLQPAFDPNRFFAAFEQRQFPPDFANRIQRRLDQGAPGWLALAGTYRELIGELDAARAAGPAGDPRVQEIRQMLGMTFPQCFAPEPLQLLAPPPSKDLGSNPLPKRLNWLNIHGSDAFTAVPITTPPLPDDTNSTTRVAWTNITGLTWTTTYSAACLAVSVGSSASKLGILKPDVDCAEYNELSRKLGAKPGQLGGFHSDAAKFYADNGYSCSTAWTGISETASAEAKKALDRGCDVSLHYTSADGTKAHEEMVTGMTLNADGTATVTTLSWGQSATVTVTDPRAPYADSTFSGKSDGNRYRQAGEAKSYLEGSGTATYYYYCRK
jgi:hypothetical protein